MPNMSRRNDYEAGIELVATTQNVVMTRTFSKLHGLAALRVGWVYCPPAIADVLNRIRGPFNVSTPAQRAASRRSRDPRHVEASVAHNEMLARIAATRRCPALGLNVTPSAANFVLIHFPRRERHAAADADRFLHSKRPHPARRRGIRPARLPAHDGRHRGGQLAVVDALGNFMGGIDRSWLSPCSTSSPSSGSA